MNREFLLEAVAGITVALLIAALAVYRTARPVGPSPWRRTGMVGVVLYAVLGSALLAGSGMTWVGVLGLLALVCLPVIGMLGAARLRPAPAPGSQGSAATAAAWARRLVGVGLAAAMLVVAGQTLSLIALVDPRAVILVVAGVAVTLLTARGMAASGRLGSLAAWLFLVPLLIALALGALLGSAGHVARPIIEVTGPPVWHVVALAAAFLLIGAADPGLSLSRAAGGWRPARVLTGSLLLVVALCGGLLAFLGGAIEAPSMQFFVVPANVNLVPGLAGVLLLVLTVILLALVMLPLSGLHEPAAADGADDASAERGQGGPWVVLGGVFAVIIALVVPGLVWILAGTSLAAAVVVAVPTRATRPAPAGGRPPETAALN